MLIPPHTGFIYLHGFLSSPESLKAQQLIAFFESGHCSHQLMIPTLPFEPAQAYRMAANCIEDMQSRPGIRNVCVIGSSLGGFYTTSLHEEYDIRAILINPAVRPYDLFEDYLGPNKHYYDGQTYILEMKHIDQLKQIDTDTVKDPDSLLLMLQTGDETLDYRHAQEKYRNCPSVIQAGGNHSFEGFMESIATMMYFAGAE